MPGRQIQIIGCGNIGRRVAQLCQNHGHPVEAWVKTDTSQAACRELGMEAHCIDFDQSFKLKAMRGDSLLLYTVAPPPRGTRDTRLRAFLEALDPAKIDKFVLISTTGVYGDCAGSWVDESQAIRPRADRALRRADAETSLQAWAGNNRVDYLILRVPGIYAPDRLPLKRLAEGHPLVAREQAPWTNRIHAEDLASVCFAALTQPVSNEIINVSDDAPSTMTEYFIAVARYSGLPLPPEISLQEAKHRLGPGMLSYLAESRRINNTKMKTLLKIKLRYPSLREGLGL